ncbi:MAG: GrpB family protein [Alphaproteobacteria bacterium]|nr:GrpB family protein [Alphaproteobacteria bacterium]MBU0858831.1 GrpB family protein [Alphaproteobacteria bacterium]
MTQGTADKFTLMTGEDLTQAARRTFFAFKDFWAPKFPDGAKIEHVGASAIPGCLTRGNVDVCVIVKPEMFDDVREKLAGTYDVDIDVEAGDDFAAFVDPACRPPLQVQLVVRDSGMDIFVPFRDAMVQDPAIVTAYNVLKKEMVGKPMLEYRSAQDAFITYVLENGAAPKR